MRRLEATHIGAFAARALRQGARGEVIATFRRSFYVALGGEVICVGPSSFGAGPLNLLAPDLKGPGAADDWTEDLDVGAPAYARGDALVVAGLEIRHRGLAPWTPPDPQERDKCALARGLARLSQTMRRRDAPALGALVAPLCEGEAGVASVALSHGFLPDTARTIAALRDWAKRAEQGELPRCERLVGLGPGLTPSGDDFLCGFMVGLRRMGEPALSERVWNCVARRLGSTNDISAAFLKAARAGAISAPLIEVFDAIIADAPTLDRRVAALDAIGHSSGWDCLSGLTAAAVAVKAQSD